MAEDLGWEAVEVARGVVVEHKVAASGGLGRIRSPSQRAHRQDRPTSCHPGGGALSRTKRATISIHWCRRSFGTTWLIISFKLDKVLNKGCVRLQDFPWLQTPSGKNVCWAHVLDKCTTQDSKFYHPARKELLDEFCHKVGRVLWPALATL